MSDWHLGCRAWNLGPIPDDATAEERQLTNFLAMLVADPIDGCVLGSTGHLVRRLGDLASVLRRVPDSRQRLVCLTDRVLDPVDRELLDHLDGMAPSLRAVDPGDPRRNRLLADAGAAVAEMVYALPHRQLGQLAGVATTAALVAYSQRAGLAIAPRTAPHHLLRLEINCTESRERGLLARHLAAHYLRGDRAQTTGTARPDH